MAHSGCVEGLPPYGAPESTGARPRKRADGCASLAPSGCAEGWPPGGAPESTGAKAAIGADAYGPLARSDDDDDDDGGGSSPCGAKESTGVGTMTKSPPPGGGTTGFGFCPHSVLSGTFVSMALNRMEWVRQSFVNGRKGWDCNGV